MAYSSSSKIRNKLYHVITKFVPITFATDDDYSHNKLETTNNLEPGSITWSKYIKPPNLRPANQKVAHIIIGLVSKNAPTNKIIQNGLYIKGKHITVWKSLANPRHCLKCQRFGHFATDCKAIGDTCARCALNHRKMLAQLLTIPSNALTAPTKQQQDTELPIGTAQHSLQKHTNCYNATQRTNTNITPWTTP